MGNHSSPHGVPESHAQDLLPTPPAVLAQRCAPAAPPPALADSRGRGRWCSSIQADAIRSARGWSSRSARPARARSVSVPCVENVLTAPQPPDAVPLGSTLAGEPVLHPPHERLHGGERPLGVAVGVVVDAVVQAAGQRVPRRPLAARRSSTVPCTSPPTPVASMPRLMPEDLGHEAPGVQRDRQRGDREPRRCRTLVQAPIGLGQQHGRVAGSAKALRKIRLWFQSRSPSPCSEA